MHHRKLALAIAALAIPSLGAAQDLPWRAVYGNSSTITVPGLPAGSRSITDYVLGDVGQGYASARFTGPDTAAGYWAMRQGTWTQYLKTGVTGATMGPGRTGAEAGHVFQDYVGAAIGAGANGQRAYVAKAGAPGDTLNAKWGVWRWDTTRNIEIARALEEGPLGPNAGAGWTFQNSSSSMGVRALNGGNVLINAYILSQTGTERLYLAKSVPGQGTVGCAMRDSTNPDFAPGIEAGDSFSQTWGWDNNISTSSEGRVYLSTYTNQSRDGIWEICNGAPRVVALDNVTDNLGPDIGIATAVFLDFNVAVPGDGNQFFFYATYRATSSDSSRTGLFWHDGATNRPLAMRDADNVYGPGWLNSVWNSFGNMSAAGQWAAFRATVTVPDDGATPSGLWRVKAGGTPQLVALLDVPPGEYGPEAGRSWDEFYGYTVLANGDIIAEARTQPGSEYAIWLLKNGAAPRRILKVGQNVSVPTASGVQQAAVTSYEISNGSFAPSRGADDWVGSDSSMLVSVGLNGYSGRVLITSATGNPIDKIFANGFDGQ